MQATTFDPYRDLTLSGQPKFPCLQHVTFDLDIQAGACGRRAFYATQKLFVKAFGNWLGLCRLGRFVAGQSGLRLTRFTCFVGVQKMDDAPRRSNCATTSSCMRRRLWGSLAVRATGDRPCRLSDARTPINQHFSTSACSRCVSTRRPIRPTSRR